MERIITQDYSTQAMNAVSYEQAAANYENETAQTEVLSCNQQLKNLLMTNLKLLKLNEITTMLLF